MKKQLLAVSILFIFVFSQLIAPSYGREFVISNSTPVQNAALPINIASTVERAEELFKQWRLGEAEATFRAVLERDGKNLRSLIGLARIEQTKYNYLKAESLLERAVSVDEDNPELIAAFGELQLAVEEPEKASKYFSRALQAAPSYNLARVGQARADFMLRDYNKAEKLLKQVISQDGTNAPARALLANIYLEANQNDRAAQEAEKVIRVDPYNVNAIFTLCLVRVAERKPDEVRRLAQVVPSLLPLV